MLASPRLGCVTLTEGQPLFSTFATNFDDDDDLALGVQLTRSHVFRFPSQTPHSSSRVTPICTYVWYRSTLGRHLPSVTRFPTDNIMQRQQMPSSSLCATVPLKSMASSSNVGTSFATFSPLSFKPSASVAPVSFSGTVVNHPTNEHDAFTTTSSNIRAVTMPTLTVSSPQSGSLYFGGFRNNAAAPPPSAPPVVNGAFMPLSGGLHQSTTPITQQLANIMNGFNGLYPFPPIFFPINATPTPGTQQTWPQMIGPLPTTSQMTCLAPTIPTFIQQLPPPVSYSATTSSSSDSRTNIQLLPPLHQHRHQPIAMVGTNGTVGIDWNDPKPLSAVTHIEIDRDSGNETSSLSPCSSSPSSAVQSRSNSFSVSNLLRGREKHPEPARAASTPNVSKQIHFPSHVTQINGCSYGNMPGPNPAVAAAAASRLQMLYDEARSGYDLYPTSRAAPLSATLPSPMPNARELCVVCSDKASGFHYGVMSCEGCKGFFRRTVQKNMEYSCHKEKACRVDRISRNRCQSCRFEKCIKSGMSKESVRQDRNRKRKAKDESKEKELDETRSIMELLKSIVQSYKKAFPVGIQLQNTKEAISRISTFVDGIPAFEKIDEVDRQKLISNGFKGLLTVRASFTDDKCIGLIGNRSADIERFRNGIASVIHEEEMALLMTVCIAQPSCPGLTHESFIEEVAAEVIRCLQTQIILRNENNHHAFSRVIFKMTDIMK